MRALARFISIVLHPFGSILILVWTASAQRHPVSASLETVAAVAALTCLPLALLFFRKVRTGQWATVDASAKSDRPALFAVAIAGVLGLLVYFGIGAPRGPFLVGGIASLALLLIAALLNRWLKASLHLAFAAQTAVALAALGSKLTMPWALGLPLLAWSRLCLGRHTAVEVIGGAALGAAAGVGLILFT